MDGVLMLNINKLVISFERISTEALVELRELVEEVFDWRLEPDRSLGGYDLKIDFLGEYIQMK